MVKFFVAATGLAAVSADRICHINNGGCSHYCYDYINPYYDKCSCPLNWELGDDGKNCQPESGMVMTTCSSNTIKMTVLRKLDDDWQKRSHEWVEAYVGDDSENDACKLSASIDDGIVAYVLEHGLEECGMTLEYVEETETLLYKVSYRNYTEMLTLFS